MSTKNKLDFTIGADPEFLALSDKGSILSANNFGGNSSYSGSGNELGQDGGGTLFECRPNPSVDPYEVVRNIHIVLKKANAKKGLDTGEFIAGSCHKNLTIGGHIHFGLKEKQISAPHATEILSNYVGPICVMIENYQAAKKRREGSYGRFMDCRNQSWGFEYRTPSSWLVCPHIASSMLCLAKTVMFETMNNDKFEGTKHFKNSSSQQAFVDNVEVRSLRDKYPAIWEDIQKMELYPLYKGHIDLLHFLVSNKLTWIRSTSMKENWGLFTNKKVYKKFTLKEVWKSFLLPVVETAQAVSTVVENTNIISTPNVIATESPVVIPRVIQTESVPQTVNSGANQSERAQIVRNETSVAPAAHIVDSLPDSPSIERNPAPITVVGPRMTTQILDELSPTIEQRPAIVVSTPIPIDEYNRLISNSFRAWPIYSSNIGYSGMTVSSLGSISSPPAQNTDPNAAF